MNSDFIFLYGPPGSGKSSLGSQLAKDLCLPFYDLDVEIETQAGQTIPEIFSDEGEDGFRFRECGALARIVERPTGVVALGGGSLLKAENRRMAEQCGKVICLAAENATILKRINQSGNGRPLLDGNQQENLEKLLSARRAHYQSFEFQMSNDACSPAETSWRIQVNLGQFFVKGMGAGYPVRVAAGGLDQIGKLLQRFKLSGQNILVSDGNVAAIYQERVLAALSSAGLQFDSLVLPPGEQVKTFATVELLLSRFVQAGLDRSSLVLALGGGVVGDLTGFSAAIYLRGVRWAALPTSLLSMVDASLGGKTGADLPQGKNLVGAFHSPVLVLSDPNALKTLPEVEFQNGLAEVVKHGVIGDPGLFAQASCGRASIDQDLEGMLRKAIAVKLKVIEEDPYEKDRRACLNLGHTLGHALEAASNYQIRHGEAVAIGMTAAAKLSESLGIARKGLACEIEACLSGLGLPVTIPRDLSQSRVVEYMQYDKKRSNGRQRVVLPVDIGDVRWGVELEDPAQWIAVMK